MTVGFPDWSRTVNQGGQQLGSFFGQKGSDPTTGIMDCLGFAYLTVQVNDTNNVNHFSIVVTWYADSGGTNIVTTSTFVPVPGSNITYQLPLVSRYARVTCSHQVFGDTENVGCITFGSNVATEQAIAGPQGEPFMAFSGSISANAAVTINAQYTYWGPACVAASNENGNTWAMQINYFDIGTASWVIAYNLQGSSHGPDTALRISLPSCPVQMVLTNTGAASSHLHGAVILG